MGWLWSDSPSKPISSPTPPNAAHESSQSTTTTAEPTSTPQAQAQPVSRDEIAERELLSLLHELEADVKPSSTKYNRVPKEPPAANHPSSFSPRAQKGTADPESLSEALLPTTMSCRDAFDRAFYCQSLGGQFNNLYRYGTVRSCSENWGDFWFCMRVRTRSDPDKRELIREHYRERERRRYGRGEGVVRVEDGKEVDVEDEAWVPRSSEDVWTSREAKVEWGTAFKEPIPKWEGSDEEWQWAERSRRARKVSETS